MGVGERVRGAWSALTGVAASAPVGRRKTEALPAILTPYLGSNFGSNFGSGQNGGATGSISVVLPKPSAVSLRRFAETPVARRAINLVKDRIASMDWQVRIRRGYDATGIANADQKINSLRLALEQPNTSDSFRTLWEGVLEDTLVGGFGAVEMKSTGDATRPFELWAIDGACVEIDPRWSGDIETPRYGFRTGRLGTEAITPLRDDELIYIRLNTRTHTPFGLGRLEVAYESIGQLLSASRYAGRLASNSVVQYALWLDEATPEQHDRLIRWWQDEIEGTGRVPVLSCEKKPEVLRFAGGTDADLRLQWQEFLIRMIGNAFDLPPMMLGLEGDVNRSTAGELADEAFQAAVVPVAKLIAEHITRDLFGKCIGWPQFEFVFNELESRDEQEEVAIQLQLLQAGVLSVAEVRAMRGLPRAIPTESPAQSQPGNRASEEMP